MTEDWKRRECSTREEPKSICCWSLAENIWHEMSAHSFGSETEGSWSSSLQNRFNEGSQELGVRYSVLPPLGASKTRHGTEIDRSQRSPHRIVGQ
jgi:hypothetical protein